MIKSVTVTNHLNESLVMELMSPENSGLVITSIEGLGPSKSEIIMTEMSGIDGSLFNSASVRFRNVLFSLRFLFKPLIEDARQESYRYFPSKKKINFIIETDNRIVTTYGYVESNEPNIFSSESGTTISILCPDAYLYTVNPLITVFSSVTSNFEFPFSNESLTLKLIEFSTLITETEKTVVYTGDASIGMLIHIHASGSASDISIIKSNTLETLSIDSSILINIVGTGISAGDDIWISTVKGNKYATLTRGSQVYNILNALGFNPTWFQLEKGDNIFAYDALSGLSNLQFEIINQIAYEGI